MNRIYFVRFTNARTRRGGEFIYVRREDIENISTNNPDDTGNPGRSMVRARGQNYFVQETPEEIVALINESRFGTQQVR